MDKRLEAWRRKIDILDGKILKLLAERTKTVKEIGKYKRVKHLSPLDRARWEKVLSASLTQGESLNLPKTFIQQIFTLIHKYSLKIQKEK